MARPKGAVKDISSLPIPSCEICGDPIPFRHGRVKISRWQEQKTCYTEDKPSCLKTWRQRAASKGGQAHSARSRSKRVFVTHEPQSGTYITCPICKNKFAKYSGMDTCGKWDCGIALRRCHQWGVATSQYNAEYARREELQKRINNNQSNFVLYRERVVCL